MPSAAFPSAASSAQRWTFTTPTPLGDTRSTYEIGEDALHYESDDLFAGGIETWQWNSIAEGATATMAGMGGRGGPDMARWVPASMEWLMLSRSAAQPAGQAGDGDKPFMRVLPQGPDRDALVNAVQARLGSRWLGEGLPLKEAQARMKITPTTFGTLKVVGLVVGVLASLVLLILVMGLLLHPIITVPAGFIIGGWLVRRGLNGIRDGKALIDAPLSKIGSAGLGLVKLEGRAVSANPSPAGITGLPSVGWDVSVKLWYEGDDDSSGEWKQVAARHGGSMDVIELEDDSGRLPVWLKDAQLVLSPQGWVSQKDELPARGIALLDELGFAWNGSREISVTEQRLAPNVTLYVLGTLDERRTIPEPGQQNALERLQHLWHTGEWRRALVKAAPGPARYIVAVLIGYLDLVSKVGKGGERVKSADASEPPPLNPSARLVWKGRDGRPFLVSNQPERAALAAWDRRSKILAGVGAAVLCFTVYQIFDLVFGR